MIKFPSVKLVLLLFTIEKENSVIISKSSELLTVTCPVVEFSRINESDGVNASSGELGSGMVPISVPIVAFSLTVNENKFCSRT